MEISDDTGHAIRSVKYYDALYRLTDADRADSFDQSWDLDGLGNFAEFDDDGDTQTRQNNAANEIESITVGWVTPTYDAAGNMLSAPKSVDETTRIHFVRDAWNRLVAVHADDPQNPGEPGDLIAKYEYDGQKRRIEKTLADETRTDYFYNDKWQLLEERVVDSESDPIESHAYVWSQRYIDAPVLRDTYDDEGELLAAARVYYAGDANFNVTALLDSTGAVLERYVYSAYGTATVYSPTWTNPAAPTADGPLYCGYFFDAETANYLARNRYYNAALATWISRDPIGYKGSKWNLYEYAEASPLSYIDPFGKDSYGFEGVACQSALPEYSRCMWRAGLLHSACIGTIPITAALELAGCAGICAWAFVGTPFLYGACVISCTTSLTALSAMLTLPICNNAYHNSEEECANHYNSATLLDDNCCQWTSTGWCGESCQNLKPKPNRM